MRQLRFIECYNGSVNIFRGKDDFILDNAKTIEFTVGSKEKRGSSAKAKLNQLKATLPVNQKLRVLEYRNDEPDETRGPCKILYE